MPIYKGNTKIVKLYKGTTQIVKRYKGTDIIYSASRLPAEFQEVEYLESSGTQCINTGFKPNQDTRVDIHFYQTQAPNNWNFIFGSRNGAGVNEFEFVYQVSGNVGWRDDYASNDRITLNNTTIVGDFVVSKNKNITSFNGTNYTHTPTTFSCNYNLLLFNTYDSTSGAVSNQYSYIKLYSCQIYDNNILVRDFVPCYRKADNVAGFYDLVNGVFYTNAGTGTFIVGGNV